MQLVRQGKISLEEDSSATNAITIESGHVNGNKDSCNAMHGDITRNKDTLFAKEDSSNADDCMSTITFTDEDLLLGLNLIIVLCSLLDIRLMIQGFNQGGQRVVGIIKMQLTMVDMVSSALFHVIDAKTSYNMLLGRPWLHENVVVPSTWHQYFKYCRNGIVKKVLSDNKPFTEAESHLVDAKYYIEDAKKKNEQPSKPPLKGFVPSNQEKEGGHEALAIDEKGFDPKIFKLLIKAGYNPKEKLNPGKLPPEATDKKLHGLNTTQMMLKEKGHAIQDSRVSLGFTPPKPVRIAIKSVNNNNVFEGFSSTENHKREENLREFVFNKLGPHRKALQEIANRQSVFERLGSCKRVGYQKKCVFKVATTLTVSCGRVLKAKMQTMIFTQVQSDEDDRKSIASSNYICNGVEDGIAQNYHITLIEDGEVEQEDAKDASVELEESIKATIDELKEVKLGNIEDL
ncbi:UNVERIFIED_CONTAM: hypothetical protein Scaly_2920900 [Sesamum calycinum]|uniref:G-patch domain-containing protein n=1 Tax=Sesamum calycinum TaxID=2727403 RepID=A0AAW2KXG3_9LAMI